MIRDYLRNLLKLAPWTPDDYNYRHDIDSLELVRFVLDLERHFGISISDADIEHPDFNTLGGLVRIIESKL